MDRYFEIQHFIHPEHPLILIDLKDSETRGLIEAPKNIKWEKLRSDRLRQGRRSVVDVSISCVLCGNEMSDTSYSCIDCDIHLHKLCAKLPTEMMHPSHPQHPLTLTHRSFGCDICLKESRNGFSYYCRSCDFDVDVKCASRREPIKHKGHPHPLYPFLRTVLSRCDACGTEHSAAAGGVSYMCNTCDFLIHEDCATLPATVKYRHHVHPLSLLVYRPENNPFWSRCSICKEMFLERWGQWIYKCDGCRHQVHTICLAKTLIAERNKTYEVDDEIDLDKVFQLPESFKYEDLVAQIIKHMTTHYGGENTALPLISHFSHKHPLTLIHNDMPSIKRKEDVLCNACVLPVSTAQVPYYSCTECNNYALHECCAKLPNVLPPHPAHGCPLILQGPDHENFGATDCPACGFYSNGFSYRRDTAACRRFAMDIKCLLPPAILHKAHKHPLKLVEDCLEEGCVACPDSNGALAYGCVSCCFYLHNACALKPIAIMHRYDKLHPFTSTSVEPIGVTKLFRLPESFQYDDLVAQMIKHMTIHYGGENTALPLISHFSHKHPLTLIHNDMPSIKRKEDVLCNACVLPVSTAQVPYYSCTECNNYALHECCAKLPNELLQHPAHPHPLILRGPDHKNFGVTHYCPACGRYRRDNKLPNEFSYRCRRDDTDTCRMFGMDIKCLLPPAILHKAHKHPLKLLKDCIEEGCVACPYLSPALAYGCIRCCFYLHNACALKPIAIMHGYAKHHPFIATSVEPIQNRADEDDDRDDDNDDGVDDDEYVCEFCEKHIKHKWWFHHCLHCDLSACSECIFPKHGGRSHLNLHLTYSSPVHHHPLSYVKLDRTNNTSLCALCQRPIRNYPGYALQCAQCKVMFHMIDGDCSEEKSQFPLVLQEGPSCH